MGLLHAGATRADPAPTLASDPRRNGGRRRAARAVLV